MPVRLDPRLGLYAGTTRNINLYQHTYSTRTTMPSAIEMNNRASHLIENDRFDEALEVLSQALSAVQTGLENAQAQESKQVDSENNTCGPMYSPDLECREATLKRRLTSLEKLEGFIYWHPMQAVGIPSSGGSRCLSVIIIFNLALCCHLMALKKDCIKFESRLLASLKLYELGLSLHMKGNNLYLDMTCALAMVNNCSQIYKIMNRPRKAKRFMGHMLSSLMIMVEGGQADALDELDGFLRNASNLILRGSVAAAA
jgi:hypothetical protein